MIQKFEKKYTKPKNNRALSIFQAKVTYSVDPVAGATTCWWEKWLDTQKNMCDPS